MLDIIERMQTRLKEVAEYSCLIDREINIASQRGGDIVLLEDFTKALGRPAETPSAQRDFLQRKLIHSYAGLTRKMPWAKVALPNGRTQDAVFHLPPNAVKAPDKMSLMASYLQVYLQLMDEAVGFDHLKRGCLLRGDGQKLLDFWKRVNALPSYNDFAPKPDF